MSQPREYAQVIEDEWNREADEAEFEEEHGMTVQQARENAQEDRYEFTPSEPTNP